MQTLLHGLPVYIADIEEDGCGIDRISLVASPAVESDFMAFNENKKSLAYSINDEDRQHVLGVIMRANYPIYRKDAGGEYFVMYRPEAIERMAEKYLREGRSSNVNIEHREGSDVEDVDMVQWFIKDTAKGIAPEGFEDIEDGSLFAEFHVSNADVWEAIKDGTFKGFSLEGVFTVTPSEGIPSEEKMPSDLLKWIDEIHHSLTYNDMTALQKLLKAMSAIADIKMGSATTKEGVIFWEGDGELAVGDAVFVEGEDGERKAAPDGDYTFEDGHVVTVAEGKVTAITEAPEAPVEDDAAPVEAADEKKEKCEDEEAPAEEEVPDYAKDAAKIWEAINDTKHRIDELRALVEGLADAIKEKQDMSSARPAHEEFTTPTDDTKKAAEGSKFARIAEIGKAMNKY